MLHAPIPVPVSLHPSISVGRPAVSHFKHFRGICTSESPEFDGARDCLWSLQHGYEDARLKNWSVVERNEDRRRTKMVVIGVERLFVWLQLSAIFDALLDDATALVPVLHLCTGKFLPFKFWRSLSTFIG
jgi:hypothetical protein